MIGYGVWKKRRRWCDVGLTFRRTVGSMVGRLRCKRCTKKPLSAIMDVYQLLVAFFPFFLRSRILHWIEQTTHMGLTEIWFSARFMNLRFAEKKKIDNFFQYLILICHFLIKYKKNVSNENLCISSYALTKKRNSN